MTIINDVKWLSGHPIEAVRPKLHAALQRTTLSHSDVLVLEAYLQVIGAQLDLRDIRGVTFPRSLQLFIGAMHSSKFISNNLMRTYIRARKFLLALHKLGCKHVPFESISSTTMTTQVTRWAREFDRQPMNSEKAWVWGGWGVTNRTGVTVGLPLYPIYRQLSRPFTERFRMGCEAYYQSRRQRGNWGGLTRLCSFIGSYDKAATAEDFQDPYWISDFVSAFGRHHFAAAKALGHNIHSQVRVWNIVILPTLEVMIAKEVIAEPVGGLPRLRGGHTNAEHVYRYITESTPGALLRSIEAEWAGQAVKEQWEAANDLSQLVKSHFQIENVKLLKDDELQEYLELLVASGSVTIAPEFLDGGMKYRILIKIVWIEQ